MLRVCCEKSYFLVLISKLHDPQLLLWGKPSVLGFPIPLWEYIQFVSIAFSTCFFQSTIYVGNCSTVVPKEHLHFFSWLSHIPFCGYSIIYLLFAYVQYICGPNFRGPSLTPKCFIDPCEDSCAAC